MLKKSTEGTDLFSPRPEHFARIPDDSGPVLVVVVDTEEDFDWSAPFSRNNTSVDSATSLGLAQRVFEEFNIRPTYVVDYPIASEKRAYGQLKEWADDGLCEIGAQCHPWVNPPYDEIVSAENTFAGNLAPNIEFEKLKILTETIANQFGRQPTIYKAGRYGIGKNTLGILHSLGYKVDMSVYAYRDFRSVFGPDFKNIGPMPYWAADGEARLLEIPLTSGFLGLLRRGGGGIYAVINSATTRNLRLTGIASRLGLLNRTTLSPEGIPLHEAMKLTRALRADGQTVFTLAFHSPSLVPGNTPYVRTESDLERLLGWLRDYFSFFIDELGGHAATPTKVFDIASRETIAPVS